MNIKVNTVHEAMLKELLKKWRMKADQYLEEKIQDDYSTTFGRKKMNAKNFNCNIWIKQEMLIRRG